MKLSSVLLALALTGGLIYYSGGVDVSLLDALLPKDGQETGQPTLLLKRTSKNKKYAKKTLPVFSPTDEFTFFKMLPDPDLDKYLGLDGKVKRQKAITKKHISIGVKKKEKKTLSLQASLSEKKWNDLSPQNHIVSQVPSIPAAGENEKSTFAVQASSFKKLERASSFVERLKVKGYPAYFSKFKPSGEDVLWYRVYLGKYHDHRLALQVLEKARSEEDLNPMIIFNKE